MCCTLQYTVIWDTQVLVPRTHNENWISTSTQSKKANSSENLWSQNQSHCNASLLTVLSHIHIIMIYKAGLIVEAKVLSYFRYLIHKTELEISLCFKFHVPLLSASPPWITRATVMSPVISWRLMVAPWQVRTKNKHIDHWRTPVHFLPHYKSELHTDTKALRDTAFLPQHGYSNNHTIMK